MSAKSHCPVCGAPLSDPQQPCPFCAEAQRLLQQLVEKEEVHLCARCGALLEDPEDELCPTCRKAALAQPSFWRRDDRIAGWIRERFVEPVAEQEVPLCPSCGAFIPPGALFCPQCGRKMIGTPEATVPAAEPVVVAPDQGEAAGDEMPSLTGPPPTDSVDSGLAAEGPSWWRQVLDFWRDQFRPRGPVLEQPAGPWHEQSWRWLRSFLGFGSGEEDGRMWLWIVVGILLVALAAMAVFWATLLRSGDLVFR